MAPTQLTAAAIRNTGDHLPPDLTTSSAVSGPYIFGCFSMMNEPREKYMS